VKKGRERRVRIRFIYLEIVDGGPPVLYIGTTNYIKSICSYSSLCSLDAKMNILEVDKHKNTYCLDFSIFKNFCELLESFFSHN
jgi:hypothetical protein